MTTIIMSATESSFAPSILVVHVFRNKSIDYITEPTIYNYIFYLSKSN